MATSRLEVNLSAIDRNFRIIREVLDAAPMVDTPGMPRPTRTAICGVIKQSAYGLGGARLARKLHALGAEMLAVYCVDEVRELADVPIPTPILCLMPVRGIDRGDPVYRLTVRNRLHLTLHDLDQTHELIASATRLGIRLPVHVQLDTGLARGGCLEDEARRIAELALTSPRLQLAGLMTHFASPSTDDAFTREQARVFKSWIEALKPAIAAAKLPAGGIQIHAANTAALLRSKSLHASMVRIGQGLYGYGFESFADPLAAEFGAAGKQLQPAVRWLSRIVHIHEVPKGTSIGYGRTFKTQRPTRVALVPVGYADGYPVALSSNPQNNAALAKVLLTGQQYDRPRTVPGTRAPGERTAGERPAWAPVVGRVSMDQITIDVTGLPDNLVKVGAEVELLGADPQGANAAPALAKAAATITHELLCRICPSIERLYVSTMGAFSIADDVHDASPAGSLPVHGADATTERGSLVA